MAKKIGALTAIFTAVLFCSVALAQEPVVNIDKRAHPNLAGAQQHIVEANRLITVAQKVNNDDMQLHAQKARQLLLEADQELKLAEAAANAANAAKAKEKGKR